MKSTAKAKPRTAMNQQEARIIEAMINGKPPWQLAVFCGVLECGEKLARRITEAMIFRGWLTKEQHGRMQLYYVTWKGQEDAEKKLRKKLGPQLITCKICNIQYSETLSRCPGCEKKERDAAAKKEAKEILEVIEHEKSAAAKEPGKDIVPAQANTDLPPSVIEQHPDTSEKITLGDGTQIESIYIPDSALNSDVFGPAGMSSFELNQISARARSEERLNQEVITHYKAKVLKECPPERYDEYCALFAIVASRDSKEIINSAYWRERARIQIKRNSKILPDLRYQKEKVERLVSEARNLHTELLGWKAEAIAKITVGVE